MAFSFSSLFSELSPSGESRKMRKKWPHNHANQIRTWCLKGKILNCEMIHKKVEVSETLKREKKEQKLVRVAFFPRIGHFFRENGFQLLWQGKNVRHTHLLMKLGIIKFCLLIYFFSRNLLLNRVFLVKNQFQWPQEVGGMSNVFSFTSRDTYKPLFTK